MMFLRHEKIMQMMPIVNGIFTHIHYSFPEILSITDEQMDLAFLSLYGLKICAPVIHVVHQSNEQLMLTDAELQTLADLILAMYKYKWDKLADILSLDYDPIHNYSDTYHEELQEGIEAEKVRTPDLSTANNETVDNDTVLRDGGSESKAVTRNTQNTRTDNLTEQIEGTGENNLYGFNSIEAVGADTNANDTTRTNTGTVGNIGSDTEQTTVNGGLTHTTDGTISTSGTKRTTGTDTENSTSDRDRVRDFTHIGNIGNLTTQQLINQEIELWRWNFIQQVLNDVKDFLTLPVYD